MVLNHVQIYSDGTKSSSFKIFAAGHLCNVYVEVYHVPNLPQNTIYCKLVIIRHVPIFAIFVGALNDEFTYWRI